MATLFTSIYDKFTPMVTDATLLLGDGSLDEYALQSCLILATDITLIGVTEVFREKLEAIDVETKEFTIDLTSVEQSMVASAMKLHWIEPFINDTDYLMTATGGTRDYSEGSHANLLKELSNIKATYKEESDNLEVAYSITNEGLAGLS